MQLTICSSDMDGPGCTALGKGGQSKLKEMPRVVLKKVCLRRAAGFGFGFFSGLNCCMQNCLALSCGMQGIDLQGCFDDRENVRISAFDCVFQKKALTGVRAKRGAIVSMRNVLCLKNVQCGFSTERPATQLKLVQCESWGNGDASYHYSAAAQLQCAECSPEAEANEACVRFDDREVEARCPGTEVHRWVFLAACLRLLG